MKKMFRRRDVNLLEVPPPVDYLAGVTKVTITGNMYHFMLIHIDTC